MRAGGTQEEAYSTSCKSNKKLLWTCVNMHTWPAFVYNRTKGTHCPECASSNFEQSFHALLQRLQIQFETQKRFDDCKDKKPLPFDTSFLNDCLGETDGPHHFEDIYGEDRFHTQQLHDAVKNKFAADHNKHLFRIAWSERTNMEKHFADFVARVKAAGTGKDRPRIERFYGVEYGERSCLHTD